MKRLSVPGTRLGGTSYLLHDRYVPAVRFAAERCDDVELLLFEAGERGESLPTPGEVAEMARVLDGEGATLHVHLPVDADFDSPENARAAEEKAALAAERAAPLSPRSFVLHVDFPSLKGRGAVGADPDRSRRTAEALRRIAARLPAPEMLAVENLEGFPIDFWDEWIEGSPYSRCFDVGHVWKAGGDPGPLLEAQLPRVRVVHLHGLEPGEPSAQGPAPGAPLPRFPRLGPNPRDHRSLRLAPPESLDDVAHRLWDAGFSGPLCLEVFRFEDFLASREALLRSRERYEAKRAEAAGEGRFPSDRFGRRS